MRILFALALAFAVMLGLVLVILAVGHQIGRSVSGGLAASAAGGPFARNGMLAKVVFGLLWLLIAGVASGLIGGL